MFAVHSVLSMLIYVAALHYHRNSTTPQYFITLSISILLPLFNQSIFCGHHVFRPNQQCHNAAGRPLALPFCQNDNYAFQIPCGINSYGRRGMSLPMAVNR